MHDQHFHRDFQSNIEGCEYFFLGNGKITAALQAVRSRESGTHGGLLVLSPEHFGRKASTMLYHPELGLEQSRFRVTTGGRDYYPEPDSSTVYWTYPDHIPTVRLDWQAGDCRVEEAFYCPVDEPALVRTVTITNNGHSGAELTGMLPLFPNLMLFDEYAVDRERKTLVARGFFEMQLFSAEATGVGDRHLVFEPGTLAAGKSVTLTAILTVNRPREAFEKNSPATLHQATSEAESRTTQFRSNRDADTRFFNMAKSSLRAAVAESGKMDGSIWQYNLEWVRDQSMVAIGGIMAGRRDLAEALLNRMLEHSVGEDGGTVDSSRTRPPETMELDQNGELLYALWTHWAWTGDDGILRRYWEKIRNLADYVLKPAFYDPEVGLLKNARELWEREPMFGVLEGYELSYQFWNVLGLEKAAEMADHLGEPDRAETWRTASGTIKNAMLHHPQFALVEEGRLIKRRRADGEPQFTFEPPDRSRMPAGMPLQVEPVCYCDPDSASVFPIMHELVDPRGELAANTLKSMETLWNQRWDTGGYARYHVSSEPDSPGPWPFATLFIARAAMEAGDDATVVRALDWLSSIQGGSSGGWLEFYGDRPVPPLPPVGIVVWTWAEIIQFFIHHVLGVRPTQDRVVLRPRLFRGLDTIEAVVPVHHGTLNLRVARAESDPCAIVDGERHALTEGSLQLPFVDREGKIEFYL